MGQALAAVRLFVAACGVTLGAAIIVLSALLPWRVRGVRIPSWLVSGLAWLSLRILGVKVRCMSPHRLRSHEGLLFPNHLSFLDPLVLLSLSPVRFLAALEVARIPVIGQITRSIDTIYVARKNRDSRQTVRTAVAEAVKRSPRPPVALFPEGRLGPGKALYPFRYGAFAVAVENDIPFMPVGLRYAPVEIARWRGGEGESLWAALWRVASYTGPLHVEVVPLPVVFPAPGCDPADLSQQIQNAMAQVLGVPVDLNPPPPRLVH